MGAVERVSNKIPGVTFSRKRSFRLASNTQKGGYRVRVELVATVNDKELWERVEQHLDGLRVFGKKNVKDEMLDALGEELETVDEEKENLQGQVEALSTRVEELMERVSRYQKLMGSIEEFVNDELDYVSGSG